MRARLAAAITVAALAAPLLAVTAGASPSAPGPEHKCRAATTVVEHKCDRPKS